MKKTFIAITFASSLACCSFGETSSLLPYSSDLKEGICEFGSLMFGNIINKSCDAFLENAFGESYTTIKNSWRGWFALRDVRNGISRVLYKIFNAVIPDIGR